VLEPFALLLVESVVVVVIELVVGGVRELGVVSSSGGLMRM